MSWLASFCNHKLGRSALIALAGAVLTVLTESITEWVAGSGMSVSTAAAVMGAWSWLVNALQTWLRERAAEGATTNSETPQSGDGSSRESLAVLTTGPRLSNHTPYLPPIETVGDEPSRLPDDGSSPLIVLVLPLIMVIGCGQTLASEPPTFRISHLPNVAAGEKITLDVELQSPKEGVVVFYRVKAAAPQDAKIELERSECGTRCYVWADIGSYEIEVEAVLKTDAESRTSKVARLDVHGRDDRRPIPRPTPVPPSPMPTPVPQPDPPVPTPPPVPRPAVLPDTMGIAVQVVAAAKASGDRSGALSLADRAAALAREIRQREVDRARAVALGQPPQASIPVSQVIERIASGIKETGPQWSAFLTAAKGCLQQLLANKKLNVMEVVPWATLLDEIAAALRDAAK